MSVRRAHTPASDASDIAELRRIKAARDKVKPEAKDRGVTAEQRTVPLPGVDTREQRNRSQVVG